MASFQPYFLGPASHAGRFSLSAMVLYVKKDFLGSTLLWNVFWHISSLSSVLFNFLWESLRPLFNAQQYELKWWDAQEAETKSVTNPLLCKQKQNAGSMFYPNVGCFERLFCEQSFNSVVALSPFPSIYVNLPFVYGVLSWDLKFITRRGSKDGYICSCFCGY